MSDELKADYGSDDIKRRLGWDPASRTCPNCGDVVPVGWTLDDHVNCNWPEEF